MKKMFLIVIAVVSIGSLHAQTWEELFNQKKTQKKYLLENIAALKVYAGYVQKGYNIARNGLNTIQSIKKGDFNLHDDFFASFCVVNPKVKHYTKVGAIIAMQVSIAKQVSATIKQCRNSNQFTVAETAYIQSVFNHLLDDCTRLLDELNTVISNGNLEMKDDERIKRIDAIYADMQDKQVFAQSFGNSANGLAVQRFNESMDITISKKLNAVQ